MTDREFWMGPDFPRQPQEVLERLKTYGACVAADAMKGFNAMNGSIQPVAPVRCVCGCAVTVRLRPGDNLLLHKAIEAARPGDILVLDTNSSYRNAVIGGIMCGAAFGKGIGGLVVAGAVRDVAELRSHDWPVFAAAVVPCAVDSEGPGQLNHPISCGGVPVHPGDIILADDNGVTVIPPAWVDWVLEGCEKRRQSEARRMAEIGQGQLTSAAVRAKLDKLGL